MWVLAMFLGFSVGGVLLVLPDKVLSFPPAIEAEELKRKAPEKAWVTWAFPASFAIFWFINGLALFGLFRPVVFESEWGAFFFFAAVPCGVGGLIGCYELFVSVSPGLQREGGARRYRLLTEGSVRIGASRLLWTAAVILGAWAGAHALV